MRWPGVTVKVVIYLNPLIGSDITDLRCEAAEDYRSVLSPMQILLIDDKVKQGSSSTKSWLAPDEIRLLNCAIFPSPFLINKPVLGNCSLLLLLATHTGLR